jgi:hypothetical protein
MRRAARVDGNQRQIVAALRAIGCTVQTLHTVGKGCPDILVGCRGTNLLMEIKDGSKPTSARRLTEDEDRWHRHWLGQVSVVATIEEAIAAVDAGC